ncbi:GTP-binding protein [Pelodictyon luteolum]|uniref:sulfate adenylyltransferase n=1 Tax=Chlorobium luteolum (strain DSM 273 / BCRC 81028 / 2530) TaxID=319225 RepID=Q3B2L8_CHLL3|nr:GTP-binding protein [Pelodictyon luteolum]ABB24413.1 adenylylsulfate kinase [Pelodictyon luteolum DSM 273]
MNGKEQMNIVIVGHVDHGKSTVIGRLLADTGSLPDGKLDAVKESCRRNHKPFEYAFLLDALKDEQAQGITIDMARCFFNTRKRDYIIIDAPGHIEFLKNMVTGASRAEAALLVIDAHEGIQENSRRHGHMVAMLGVKQVSVLVNKMDLAGYRQVDFDALKAEYTAYLRQIDVEPLGFIPVSAREGDNIAAVSASMPWYDGPTVLAQLDRFSTGGGLRDKPFRLPVQDVYKFTGSGDDRRIVAGTIEAGSVNIGDAVLFLPSGKRSSIASVESFNTAVKHSAKAGEAVGVTLATQIYIRPGELMVRPDDPQPEVGARFRANIFWVGRVPMSTEKEYKLKLGTAHATVRLAGILSTLDASDLRLSRTKQQLDNRDVGECILETTRPIAFDLASTSEATGRFVIVDNYEIAGGGIVLENLSGGESILERHIRDRERHWENGNVLVVDRERVHRHRAKFIVIVGPPLTGKRALAKELESMLFRNRYSTYYLGMAAIEHGLEADLRSDEGGAEEKLRRIGELARIMTDAGLIFITVIDDPDDYDIESLKLLNAPNEILVVNVGENRFYRTTPDVILPSVDDIANEISRIADLLLWKEVIDDYQI